MGATSGTLDKDVKGVAMNPAHSCNNTERAARIAKLLLILVYYGKSHTLLCIMRPALGRLLGLHPGSGA